VNDELKIKGEGSSSRLLHDPDLAFERKHYEKLEENLDMTANAPPWIEHRSLKNTTTVDHCRHADLLCFNFLLVLESFCTMFLSLMLQLNIIQARMKHINT
jgi:hypothetical protein